MQNPVLIIILAAAIFSITSCKAETVVLESNSSNKQHFTPVLSPDIPTEVIFADKPISLDRIDMYERFDRELSSMTYTHSTTLLTLKRANRLFPMLLPILRQHGIPSDLIYLACIESNLNIRAYSSAKAGGLWQFIPSTAKAYGLEVNDFVDERYDPILSTHAACKMLKKAYRQYGNWETVAASYNAGGGRISKELDAQQQSSAYDLHLVNETSRYLFRLLAMKQIMEHPSMYGYNLRPEQFYNPISYENIQVNEAIESWVEWAAQYGISYQQLREHNPWIRAKSLPNKTNKTYNVRIPNPSDLNRTTANTTIFDQRWIDNEQQ